MSDVEIGRSIPPVRKSIEVALAPAEAFLLFTERMVEWWPKITHSVAGEDAGSVVFEPREGGSIYEVSRSEETSLWGGVLAWEPPGRVVFSWHPGRSRDTAQEVEVTFIPLWDGSGSWLRLLDVEELLAHGVDDRFHA